MTPLLPVCKGLLGKSFASTPTKTLICPLIRISSASRTRSSTSLANACPPSSDSSSSGKSTNSQFPTLTTHLPQSGRATVHCTPDPGITLKSLTETPSDDKVTSPPQMARAALTIALPRGCSLLFSAHAASQSPTSPLFTLEGIPWRRGSLSSATLAYSFFSASTARPDVMVPVCKSDQEERIWTVSSLHVERYQM